MDTQGSRDRIDIAEMARRFGRHTVTLARWERQGILPRSHRVGGRRCWFVDEVREAENRLAEIERARQRRVPPEKAIALAATGRAAKRVNASLRAAAAEALAVGGVALVQRSLTAFTQTARLEDIPIEKRADAAATLIAAVCEVRRMAGAGIR